MRLDIGQHTIYHGDSRDVLATIPDNSISACVCDPPYALVSIVKRFGQPGAAPAKGNDAYARASAGFMGQSWDTGEVAFATEFWAQVLRVLKPGGHVVAFSGTRTYHRLAVAIEDSGFEIRDQLAWVYAQGFPKSHNLDHQKGKLTCGCDGGTVPYDQRTETLPEHDMRSMLGTDVPKAIPFGEERREVLQPGMSEYGAPTQEWKQLPPSEIRTGQPGVEGGSYLQEEARELRVGEVRKVPPATDVHGTTGWVHNGTPPENGGMGWSGADQNRSGAPQGPQPAKQRTVQSGTMADKPGSQTSGTWPLCGGCGKPIIPNGLGTSLKPAWEPIVLARKPLIGTVAANVLEHGTGAINIDGCRVGDEVRYNAPAGNKAGGNSLNMSAVGMPEDAEGRTAVGRFPANILHDGEQFGENGRYFYSPKASKKDRGEGNIHPTVKPTDLMAYLCRLVTPPGGVVLDPFMGSGSTGKGAHAEGFRFIGIEREENFFEIAAARLMDLA